MRTLLVSILFLLLIVPFVMASTHSEGIILDINDDPDDRLCPPVGDGTYLDSISMQAGTAATVDVWGWTEGSSPYGHEIEYLDFIIYVSGGISIQKTYWADGWQKYYEAEDLGDGFYRWSATNRQGVQWMYNTPCLFSFDIFIPPDTEGIEEICVMYEDALSTNNSGKKRISTYSRWAYCQSEEPGNTVIDTPDFSSDIVIYVTSPVAYTVETTWGAVKARFRDRESVTH